MKITRQEFGMHLLRLSIAGVFLYFGFSQIFDSLNWVGVVPEWAVDLVNLPPALIVMINGIMEIVLASLLAMGFFVRIISFLLALHLVPIALSFGFSATAMRDIGLALSSFALSFVYTKTSSPSNDNVSLS